MMDPVFEDWPDGAETVIAWLRLVYGAAEANPALWRLLDDPLRLSLAQGWVLHQTRNIDEDLAEELAADDSGSPQFDSMMGDLVDHWRKVYVALRDEIGILHHINIVGVDMELVVLTGPEHIGPAQGEAPIPAHCFVVRFEDDEWRIAALARRLPVPGWPPTEEIIPGLSIDG
jgi:hypothetical protein